ncbi:MAG: DUF2752 domain-containing protein [Bacteroidia bacterium]|jgi:hypothetical protein|nr:DUF2752 domain-containing protein [Bacteroidia bacterium]
MEVFIHWLEQHLLECPFRSQFGVSCPGCGFQRSLILLLGGNIWGSIVRFPALLPFLSTWLLLISHLIFRFRHGAKMLMWFFGTTALVMMINFIVRIILFGVNYP